MDSSVARRRRRRHRCSCAGLATGARTARRSQTVGRRFPSEQVCRLRRPSPLAERLGDPGRYRGQISFGAPVILCRPSMPAQGRSPGSCRLSGRCGLDAGLAAAGDPGYRVEADGRLVAVAAPPQLEWLRGFSGRIVQGSAAPASGRSLAMMACLLPPGLLRAMRSSSPRTCATAPTRFFILLQQDLARSHPGGPVSRRGRRQ